jgi:hypothetical protein
MNVKPRAQASIEYVIILTVVILIALIVAAVLANFPIQGGDVTAKQSAEYWNGAEIGMYDTFFHSASGSAYLRNNKPRPVQILNVSSLSGATVNTSSVSGFIQSGQNVRINIAFSGCASGSIYSERFFVTYRDQDGNAYNFTGSIPLVGRCEG